MALYRLMRERFVSRLVGSSDGDICENYISSTWTEQLLRPFMIG